MRHFVLYLPDGSIFQTETRTDVPPDQEGKSVLELTSFPVDFSPRAYCVDINADPKVLIARIPPISEARAFRKIEASQFFNGLLMRPATLTVDGSAYQIDPASRAAMDEAATIAAREWDPDFYWIAADNTRVSLTAQQMIDLHTAVWTYVSACRQRLRVIKDAIDAAATADEVAGIDITSGYPANGGE